MQDVRTISGCGPFTPAPIEAAERKAQLRSFGALALVHLGPDHPLVAELRDAEVDPVTFARAHDLVEALPALVRRRIFSTFMRLTRPRRAP